MSPEEAVDFQAAVFERHEALSRATAEWEGKDAAAKAAKKRMEAANEELIQLVAEARKGLPLFDRPRADPPAGMTAEAPAGDAGWREASISVLHVEHGLPSAVEAKLRDAGLDTIGRLADFTAADNRLTDVPGIGPAKAEAVEDALAKFWAARQNFPPAPLGEAGNPAENADAPQVEESTPDGGAVESGPLAAWRTKPLIDLVDPCDWPGPHEKGACLSAVDALALEARDDDGIGTLGELIDELIDVLRGPDGGLPIQLDDLAVAREDDGPDGLTDAEVKALRFALLSYRERDAEFARDVPVGLIDPTADRRWYEVRFKARKGKPAKAPVYLLCHSPWRANGYAQEQWGDQFAVCITLDGGPPEGAVTHHVGESYEDRRAAAVQELKIDEQIAAEKAKGGAA